MNSLQEFQGHETPSMVFIVTRRWNLPGEPWSLGKKVGSEIEWQNFADHQRLLEGMMAALGYEVDIEHRINSRST